MKTKASTKTKCPRDLVPAKIMMINSTTNKPIEQIPIQIRDRDRLDRLRVDRPLDGAVAPSSSCVDEPVLDSLQQPELSDSVDVPLDGAAVASSSSSGDEPMLDSLQQPELSDCIIPI